MALSIRDEETDRLVRRLAKQNGETVTMAVKVAVKGRIERQELHQRSIGCFERIRSIVERTALRMNDGRTSKELMEELYDDETGLPR